MRLHRLAQAAQIVVVTVALGALAQGSIDEASKESVALGTLANPNIKAGSMAEASPDIFPYRIRLTREQVPVRRKGKVVSFKSSYSGLMNVGSPTPQEFRVVFDTGSGQVVLPSIHCESETCLKHQRYNESASAKGFSVDSYGLPSPEEGPFDQVTIGYGSGQVTGEFYSEQVCLGPAPTSHATAEGSGDQPEVPRAPCVEMNIVAAVEMSPQPFSRFAFDGVLGLGLTSLAVSSGFSLFEMLVQQSPLPSFRFSIFLTDEDGEDLHSEIAIGGHNPDRLIEPFSWLPVTNAHLGHWQVEILSVRIGGKVMSACEQGGCRGIMDTGSSHLGIPGAHNAEFARLLTIEAEDSMTDCRFADAPLMEIELPNYTITIHPEDYMRRLPLMEGVSVESITGVALPGGEQSATTTNTIATESGGSLSRYCRPRSMPVNLPEPLGPLLFILGEPVLQRYVTSYDWKELKVGVALSSNVRLRNAGTTIAQHDLDADDGDDIILLQFKTVITIRVRSRQMPRLLA